MKLIAPILAAALAAHAAFAQPPADQAAPEAKGKVAFVTDRNLRPDGERTEPDTLYESRVLGAFRGAQGSQGSLDGPWHILGPGGVAIYTLQVTDPGAGEARIEGAWRNLKTSGPGASGFIESVRREGADLILTFREGAAEGLTELTLRPGGQGAWDGELVANNARTDIIASRAQGLETASMSVPVFKNPPPPKAKAKPKNTRSKSKNTRRRR